MAPWIHVSECPICGFPIYFRRSSDDSVPEVKATCDCQKKIYEPRQAYYLVDKDVWGSSFDPHSTS